MRNFIIFLSIPIIYVLCVFGSYSFVNWELTYNSGAQSEWVYCVAAFLLIMNTCTSIYYPPAKIKAKNKFALLLLASAIFAICVFFLIAGYGDDPKKARTLTAWLFWGYFSAASAGAWLFEDANKAE